MKKLLILSMFRFGLIIMALFTILFGAVFFLEVIFEINHAPANLVITVLISVFLIPMILLSFLGVAFFNSKIEEHKRVIAS